MNRFLAGFAMLAVVSGSGCGFDRIAGPPAEPTGPGMLELRVSIPQAGASALLLAIGGGAVDSLTSDLDVVGLASSATDRRAIVRGAMDHEATVRLWVPDVALRSHYFAVIEQVVNGTTYERRDATDYKVRITSPSTRSTRRPSA